MSLKAMARALKPASGGEHPIVAWISIAAILLAILLISWARFEVHGTGDIEAALSEEEPGVNGKLSKPKPSPDAEKARLARELDDAVAAGRWATGLSP
jgi:hypothetical protein